MNHDPVNHPSHYTSSNARCSSCGNTIECIDVTRHLGFNIGNAIKYAWRFGLKNGIQDLEKAAWYINDEIKKLKVQEECDAATEVTCDDVVQVDDRSRRRMWIGK